MDDDNTPPRPSNLRHHRIRNTRRFVCSAALVATLLIALSSSRAQPAEGSGVGATHDPTPDLTTDPDALPDVDEVMERLNDMWRADSSHSIMSMTVVTANFNRTLEMEGWSIGTDQSLVVIRSPAREAGTATLRTPEGLWNYAPRADRLMRVPSGLLGESWMGSHFSNEDLMRESSYVNDYVTTLSWSDEDGSRYLVATAVPHPDTAVVWSRIEFVVSPDDYVPIRADYFDDDDCVRTMAFSDVQEIDDVPVPMTMRLIVHDFPDESTVVTYGELEFDIDVDDALFTQRGLRRAAQRR